MEKYLKIHWSIRIILSIILSIFILFVISSIYGIVFYKGIQETLIIMSADTENRVTIPVIIITLLVQLLGIFVLYKIYNYKRWAILLIFIFIGLPIIISSFGVICYILFMTYTEGIDKSGLGIIPFIIVCTIILNINGFFIKFNIELIRLYKNIKNIHTVESKFLRITKPKFLSLFLISSIPTIILGGLMMLLYNPVVPLDVPEGYFKIDGFDLGDPNYTDQKICKEFESAISKMSENIRNVTKEETNSGVILAKRAMFSKSDIVIKRMNLGGRWEKNYYLEDSMEEIQKEKPKEYAIIMKQQEEEEQKRSEFKAYTQSHPEEWKKALLILRSQLTEESVNDLQKLTQMIPQNFNCNIRNDQNVSTELYPSLTKYLVVSRIYDAAIKLALLENNRKKSIALLSGLHELNTKFFSSNINLVKGMIGKALIDIEFGSVESVIEKSDPEEMQRIQEIYKTPYNIKESEINAWKGEYYMFEHVLTGRGKSIKQLSIPYILNGEDTLNRMILMVYAPKIARVKNDTIMQQKIDQNITINSKNLFNNMDQSLIGIDVNTWKGNGLFFPISYNYVGQTFIAALAPSLESSSKKYQELSNYQDYIRYDLLGIEKNN